ncbi:metal-dependent transcriptional regulator [Leucobacter sp. UCMA 4100]|uniref:metal-dependent transcriptional regulator n=1 Tax=Leucobacter sp. UCMA 4100 TaxID=2810534 RepID=UPI0022EA94F9|nr:metal-dependent transcriptional regulator [Leucobacter sp. UCMA 4100]MDA3147282.1 metal-dependent transcriptional regulator [Leucobacter sp. UCMA 4100]
MTLSELTTSAQNYLKVVWASAEWSDAPITASIIAERLGLRMSTVSEGIRKLAAQGLVNHTPYGSVQLTELGHAYALQMVRRHRLIETFLVQVLGYGWDEVHDEAEHLEHAVSDLMIERIDVLLGHPVRDPHGDPIPTADGKLLMPQATQLSIVPLPATVCVERIADDDPALLLHCDECKITVGSLLRVTEGAPYSSTITVTHVAEDGKEHGETITLGRPATDAIYVSQPGHGETDE